MPHWALDLVSNAFVVVSRVGCLGVSGVRQFYGVTNTVEGTIFSSYCNTVPTITEQSLPAITHCKKPLFYAYTDKYSRTSMARTLMARSPRLFRTRS